MSNSLELSGWPLSRWTFEAKPCEAFEWLSLHSLTRHVAQRRVSRFALSESHRHACLAMVSAVRSGYELRIRVARREIDNTRVSPMHGVLCVVLFAI